MAKRYAGDIIFEMRFFSPNDPDYSKPPRVIRLVYAPVPPPDTTWIRPKLGKTIGNGRTVHWLGHCLVWRKGVI